MKLASNMRGMRVGRRILLQILLLVAVVSALLSVASFLQNRSAMLTNTQDTLTARAGESAKTIAAAIENKRFILKNIATLPAVQATDAILTRTRSRINRKSRSSI